MDDITKQPYAKWLEESIATIAGIDPCCICFAATKADGTVFTDALQPEYSAAVADGVLLVDLAENQGRMMIRE